MAYSVKVLPMAGLFSVLLPYTAYLALLLRVWVGANFVAHGYPKLGKAKAQTLQWTKSLGVPTIATYLAIILEFFGGLSLIIGFIVPIVAFFIALEMVGAILLKKTKMKAPYMGQNSYEIDITYLMLAIALLVLGAGLLSVDSFLGL
ncbi:MAG: DoxX family protein [Candidatus Bathyarchaeia archaeon]|jgi:putative oxidoreductase